MKCATCEQECESGERSCKLCVAAAKRSEEARRRDDKRKRAAWTAKILLDTTGLSLDELAEALLPRLREMVKREKETTT